MFPTRMICSMALTLLLGGLLACNGLSDEKKEAPAKKKGTVVGTLSAKGDNWIEVKADGEEKGRRYVPHWRGGAPADGGGPDKKMLARFKELKIGTRVRIEWVFEERARVEKIEVLKSGKEKDKEKPRDEDNEKDAEPDQASGRSS